jgi:ubiquinone/menaquinone biosynthesis C-methylase UbiE
MKVLEPGPGMGFFTFEIAKLVGPSGRVTAVDIQDKMLKALERRLKKAGLLDRMDLRLAKPETMGLDDIAGTVDFASAFAVVHELPSPERFFREITACLKTGACLLFVEPKGHVTAQNFEIELSLAEKAGLRITGRPFISRSHAALFTR